MKVFETVWTPRIMVFLSPDDLLIVLPNHPVSHRAKNGIYELGICEAEQVVSALAAAGRDSQSIEELQQSIVRARQMLLL